MRLTVQNLSDTQGDILVTIRESPPSDAVAGQAWCRTEDDVWEWLTNWIHENVKIHEDAKSRKKPIPLSRELGLDAEPVFPTEAQLQAAVEIDQRVFVKTIPPRAENWDDMKTPVDRPPRKAREK